MTKPGNGWHRRPTTGAHIHRQHEYNSRAYRDAGRTAYQQVITGTAYCWRCRRPIPPTARRGPDWQLGHDDNDRRIIRGPEHTSCNLRAAARKGNRITNRRLIRAQSRAW